MTDINKLNETLWQAARDNNLDAVRRALDDGAQVNYKNAAGNTALIFAAARGHLEVFQELMKRNADPSIKNGEGKDALYYARDSKRTNIIILLRKAMNLDWEKISDSEIKHEFEIDSGKISATEYFNFESRTCITVLTHADGKVSHSREPFSHIPVLVKQAARELKNRGGQPNIAGPNDLKPNF